MEIKTYRFRSEQDYIDKNIQMQFASDEKFSQFVKEFATTGSQFCTKLFSFANLFNIDTLKTVQNKAVLNAVGGLLGLPPIDFFSTVVLGEISEISKDDYILLIKGQQLKNTWDGTNKGIIDTLNTLYPEYIWDIADIGNETITVYMIQSDVKINNTVKSLFEGGWLTPKPAGVQMIFQTVTQGVFTWDSSENDETWDNGIWL